MGTHNYKSPYIDTTTPDTPKILEDATILKIAQAHKASPAQVLLKWNMSRGCSVLCRTSKESEMKEDLESLKLELSQCDIDAINHISIKHRYWDLKFLAGPGHTVEEIFDEV
ncbi:Aldo-keto reductase family 1 member C2 [Thelohanellus kitauei]|nr:Aldo-keto reductase family 1 member C2 [Thelohanellus kitauei]